MNQAGAGRGGALAWLSPEAALLFSYAVALACILFPRGAYEALILEPNRIHLSAPVFAFVTLCLGAFALGLLAAHIAVRARPRAREAAVRNWWADHRAGAVLVVVIGTLAANFYLLLAIMRGFSIGAFLLALAMQARAAETTEHVLGVFGAGNYWIPAFTPPVVCLGLWTWLVCRGRVGRGLERALKWSTLVLAGTAALILLLTLKRSPLAMFALNVLAVWFLYLHHQGSFTFRRFLRYVLPLAVAGVAFFGIIQVSRTLGLENKVVGKDVRSALVGYFAGAYNRLAFIVDGDLWLGSPGGYYWTWPVWEFAGISTKLGLDRTADELFFSKPTAGASERSSEVWSAGLRGHFTAVTAFGMAFTDFAWWGFIPFMPYGLLAGLLWHQFRRGAFWGVMLYPAVLWTILDLRGYLNIVRERTIGPFLFGLAVWVFINLWASLLKRLEDSIQSASASHATRPVQEVSTT